MAKNDKFKLSDDYGFGSSLDIPNINGTRPPKIKNDRNPITHIAIGVGKGIKDTVVTSGFIRNMIKNALPQGYGAAIDLAGKTTGGVKNLYNDAMRDVKPVMADLKRTTEKLVTAADKAIPKPVADKIKDWTKPIPSDIQRNMTQEEMRDATMKIQLGEIFKFQTQHELQRDAKNHAKDSIRSGIEQARHRDQLTQLSAMRVSLQQIANYQQRVDSAFQRKSLETQIRHYYVAVDQLNEIRRHNLDAITQLQLITKNTSLPDFVKLKTSERLKEVMRNDFVSGLNDSVFAKRREFFKNIGDAIVSTTKSRLGGLFSGIRSGLTGAEMGLDMASQSDFDDGTNPMERHARRAIGMVGDLAGAGIGGWVGRKAKGVFEKHPRTKALYQKITKTGKKLNYGVNNAQQEINERMNSYDRSKHGKFKNYVFDFANDIRNTANSTKTGLIKDSIANMQEPTPFTRGVAKSITEVIPGFLSMMLRELQMARNGGHKTELTKYDHTTGKFVTKSSLDRNLFSSIIKADSVKDVRSTVNNLIGKVESSSGKRLTADQRRILGNQMLEDNLKHNLPGVRFSKTSAYRGEAKQHADVFAGMFDKHFADQNRKESYVDEFNSLGSQIHDPRELIQHYQNVGYGNELSRMGFVKGASGMIDISRIKPADRKKLEESKLISKGQTLLDSNAINISNADIFRRMGIHAPSGSNINMEQIYRYHYGDKDPSGPNGRGRGGRGGRINFGPRKPSPEIHDSMMQRQFTQVHAQAMMQEQPWAHQHGSQATSATGPSLAAGMKARASEHAKRVHEAFSGFGFKQHLATAANNVRNKASSFGKTSQNKAAEILHSLGELQAEHGAGEKLSALKDAAKAKARETVEATRAAVDELSKKKMFGPRNTGMADITGQDKPGKLMTSIDAISATLLRIEHKLHEGVGMFGAGEGPVAGGKTGSHWWNRSFLNVTGSAAKGAMNVASRAAKIANNVVGGSMSNLFGLAKGTMHFASGAKDKMLAMRDVYVKDDPEGQPRLESRKLRRGLYRDQQSGKPVTSFKDITGTLIDENGNVVLHDYEIKDAYLKGKLGGKLITALGAGFRGLKSLSGILGGGPGAAISLGLKVSKFVSQKAWGLLNQAQDVYTPDDLRTPKLLARTMRADGYRSTVSGKIIKHPGQIDGAVDVLKNGKWEEAMTAQEVASGIVDRNGRPIKTGISKLLGVAGGVAKFALNQGRKLVSHVNKVANTALTGAKHILGFAKNTVLHGVSGWGEHHGAGIDKNASEQGISLLSSIRDILDARLPKPRKHVVGDIDGSGIRSGSYQDEVRKGLFPGESSLESYAKAHPGKGEAGGSGGLLGMLGGLFGGKKKSGEGSEEHEEHGGVKDIVEGELLERGIEKAGGKFGKAMKWGKGALKSGGKFLGKGLGKIPGVGKLLGLLGLGGAGLAEAGSLAGGTTTMASGVGGTGGLLAKLLGVGKSAGGIVKGVGGKLAGGLGKIAAPLAALLSVFSGVGDESKGKHVDSLGQIIPEGLLGKINPFEWAMNASRYAGNKINKGVEATTGGSIGTGIYNMFHHDRSPNDPATPEEIAAAKARIEAAKNRAKAAAMPQGPVTTHNVHRGDLGDVVAPGQPTPEGSLPAPMSAAAMAGAAAGSAANAAGLPATWGGDISKLTKEKLTLAQITDFGKATPAQKKEILAKVSPDLAKVLAGAPNAAKAKTAPDSKPGFWSDVGSNLGKAYNGAVDATSSAMGKAAGADWSLKGMAGMAGSAWSGAKDLYNKAVGSVSSGIESTVNTVQSAIKTVKNAYNDAVDKTADAMFAVAGAPKKAVEAARSAYNKAIAVASNGIYNLMTGPSAIGKAYDSAVDKAHDALLAVSGAPATAAKLARDSYNQAIASAGSMYGFAVGAVKSGVAAVKSGINAAVDAGKNAYTSAVNKTSDAMMSTDKAVTGAANDVKTGFKEGEAGKRGADGNLKDKPKASSGMPATPPSAIAASANIPAGSSKGTGGSIDKLPQPTTRGSWAGVKDTILGAAKMVGVDGMMLGTIAAIESGFDWMIKAGTSSATGLFQFVSGTWTAMVNKYGAKYGISKDTPATDARANALMGAEFMRENGDALKGVVDRPLTDTDLYLAHFLGVGGAKNFLKADPNAIAAEVMPAAAKANKAIFYSPDGQPRTFAAVYAEIDRRVRTRGKQFGLSSGNPNPLSVGSTAKTDTKSSAAGSGIPDKAGDNTPAQKPIEAKTSPSAMASLDGGYAGSATKVATGGPSSGIPAVAAGSASASKGLTTNTAPSSMPVVTPPAGVGSTPSDGGSATGSSSWNAVAAVNCLNNNAGATSQGRCAEFVRKAVEAGGVTLKRTTSAKDYGGSLRSVGFSVVNGNSPQAGDVAIIQPVQGHPHGHATMFNGQVWVSDFIQHNGYYPGPQYRQDKPPVAFYRHPDAAKTGAKQMTTASPDSNKPSLTENAAATDSKGLDGNPDQSATSATASTTTAPGSTPVTKKPSDTTIPVSNVTPGIVSNSAPSGSPTSASGSAVSPAGKVLSDAGNDTSNAQAIGGGFLPPRSSDMVAQSRYQSEGDSKAFGNIGDTLAKSYEIHKQTLTVLTTLADFVMKSKSGQDTQTDPGKAAGSAATTPSSNQRQGNMSRAPVSMSKHGSW